MDEKEKLLFLKDLLNCGYSINLLTYEDSGNPISDDPLQEPLFSLFEKTGCLEFAVNYKDEAPLFLSSGMGILWGTVNVGLDEDRRIYVLGPVLNNMILSEKVDETINAVFPDFQDKKGLKALLDLMPIVPMPMFQNYILMLVFTLTGKKLLTSDIHFQTPEKGAKSSGEGRQKRNRRFTYMAEQDLLYHVREGNMDYHKALSKSSSLSTGVQITTANPVTQASISTIVFTSLCAREAIKGGLSPDIAYAVGDAYIQNMSEAKSISELSALSHNMYTDFIGRVKKAKEDSKYSKTVQECCDYILTHMEDELSIAVLAEQFGYTPYYLSRKFKAETGISVAHYIDQVRIEKAKVLLLSTKETVAEIARRLCYCSSTYFSDTFKQIVGVLPHEYRKMNI